MPGIGAKTVVGRDHALTVSDDAGGRNTRASVLPACGYLAFSAVSSAWPLGLPKPVQASHPAPA